MPNEKLKKLWDEAFANPGEKMLLGDLVVCDVCNEDFTESDERGGFVFGSYAYCPKCAKRSLTSIYENDESRYINAWAEPGESFADFVRRFRSSTGSDFIWVTGGDR